MSVNVISELGPLLLPQPGELKAAYTQTFHRAPSKTPKSSLTQFPHHTQKSSFSWLSSPSLPRKVPELVLVWGRVVRGMEGERGWCARWKERAAGNINKRE